MLSDDSDEESEEIVVSPYKEETEKHEALGEDDSEKVNENESTAQQSEGLARESPGKSLAPRAEKVVSRIARLWRQHMEDTERRGEQRDLNDRLAMSAEYRSWVTGVDLKSGEALPSFTDVWVELELNKRPSTPKGEGEWQQTQSQEWEQPEKREDWGPRRRWQSRWHNTRQGESWKDGEHKEARIILAPAAGRPVLKEVSRAGLALKPAPTADPLADFAAEGSVTYLRERDAVVHDGRHHRHDRPVSPDRPPRHKAHLAPANSYYYDQFQSLRIFDDCLQDMCNRGLKTDLPIRASVFLDEMYQRDSHFRMCDTPFRDFSELLDAAEKEGLVKVNRSGSQEYISKVKYPYRVLTRRDEYHPERERRRRRLPSKSRSRSRGARVVQIREVSHHRRGGDHREDRGDRGDRSDRGDRGDRGERGDRGRRNANRAKRASPQANRSRRGDGGRDEQKPLPVLSAREKRREAALKTAKAKARPKALPKEGGEDEGTNDQASTRGDRRMQAKSKEEDNKQPFAAKQVNAKTIQATIQAKRQKLVEEAQRVQEPNQKEKAQQGGSPEEGESSSSYYSDEDSNESSSSSDESEESESEPKEDK